MDATGRETREQDLEKAKLVSTFQRTYKYARSGFFPCHETKLKILRAVSQLAFVEEDMLSRSLYEGHD